MAKKNKIDIDKLAERLSSKFGTKLPSNQNKETERSEDQLIYTQMIMGSLASMIWGERSVKNENKISSLLGRKDNIYNLIDSIKKNFNIIVNKENKCINVNLTQESVNTLKTNLSEPIVDAIDSLYSSLSNIESKLDVSQKPGLSDIEKLSIVISDLNENQKKQFDTLQTLNDLFKSEEFKNNFINKIELTFEGSGLGDYEKLITSLNELDIDKDQFKGLKTLEEVLNSLEKSTSFDTDKINKNLTYLTDLFVDGSSNSVSVNFEKLFKNISNILNKEGIEEISKDITGLNSVLQTLITVISIDPKSINLKGLRTLLSISDPKRGLIKKLVKNLQDISEDIKINDDVFDSITTFFESLSSIGEIGFIKRMKIKSNIKYFINFIGEEIPKLIDEIKKSEGKTIESETVKSIAAIGSIFESLSKIGELKFKDKIRMKMNMMYIRYFIINDVITILKDIISEFNTITPDAFKSIEELNKLFEKLTELSETSLRKLFKLSINLGILEDIIRTQLIGSEEEGVGVLMAIAGLDVKLLNKVLLRLEKLEEIFDALSTIISNEDLSLKNSLLFILKLHVLNTSIDSVKEALNKFDDFDGRVLNGIISKTAKLNIIFNNLSNISANDINQIKLNISLRVNVKNAYLMKDIIETLNTIKPGKNIENVFNVIKLLTEIKANSINAFLFKKTLKIIKSSIELINDIYESLANVEGDDIKKAKLVIASFNEILVKTAAVLLIAGLAMRYINPMELIAYAVTLGTFMWGLTKIFSLMAKTIENDIKVSKEAINLVLISGAILILGGVFMNIINPTKLMLFGVTLGLFMIMISGAYLIFSATAKEAFASAKDFSYLIMISAGVLMLGGIFMKSGLWWRSLLFGVILIAFVSAITFAYNYVSQGMNAALGVAKEFSILIAISAMTLMLGAMFMANPKRLLAALLFELMLLTFITGVMGILKWASKDIKTAMSTMLAISTLVAVAASTLLIGGLLFTLFPNLIGNVILFGITLVAFVGIIGLLCFALNKFKKYIQPGILVLGGIIILMGLATIALGLLAVTSWLIDNYAGGRMNVLKTAGLMAIVFGGLAVLCFILGMPKVALAVGIGIVVMGGMTLLLYLMIGAVAAMVAVVKYASSLENVEETLDKIGDAVWGFVKLTPKFMALSAASLLIAPGIAATFAISAALSSVAKTIQLWSNLRIPEYDEHGKIVGYKTMGKDEFDLAKDNIKNVLTTIFSAVKEVYNENSDIFNMDWNTLFTGKNPIQRVISSSIQMDKMLIGIARGIKAWTKLTIPEYDSNGKIKGYKTIDNSAFTDAAENIKAVITCLGQAIIDVYNEAPDGMFESTEWFGLGNTPFAKVAKALKTMGPMLSSIADGVKDWTELKIPKYTGNKITGYKNLSNDNFNKASENIKSVVSCFANAVLAMYEENPDMFEDDSWHGFGDTPFARVTKSLKTMGDALGNIADAVKAWSSLKIPIYGDKKDATKITGYQTIDNKVFKKVAQNIRYVVTTLANSIAALSTDPQYGTLFTDSDSFWDSDTKVAKVLKSIKPMGSALKDIADAIKAWSELKVPEYNDPKNGTKITGYKQLTNADILNTKENIRTVICTLIEGIYYAYTNNKPIFEESSEWFGLVKGDSPIAKVLKSMNPIGKALKNIAGAVKSWAELKIPIYNGKSLEPTGYLSIGGGNIKQAINNIQIVISSIIDALVDTYNGDFGKSKMNGKDIFKKDNEITKNMLPSISKMTNMISSVAKGISSIAALKIPVYNAKGKVIAYHNIEDGDFKKVGTVINSVLTAVGKALVKVANDPSINPEKNPNFKVAVEAIKYSTDILGNLADVIANYATGKFVLYKVQRGKLVPEKVLDINNPNIQSNIQKNITTILKTIGDTLALFVGVGKDNKLKYATDHNNKQIVRTKNVLITLINSISEVYGSIGKLNNAIEKNKEAINKIITNDDKSDFKNLLEQFINKYDSLIISFALESTLAQNISKAAKHSKTITNEINTTYNALINLINKFISLNKKNTSLQNIDFSNISESITKFTTALSNINTSLNSVVLSNNSKTVIERLVENTEQLIGLLNNFVELIKLSKTVNSESYDDLKNGILSLYNTVSSIKIDTTIFLNYSSFTDLLEDYIKTINGLGTMGIFDNNVNSLKDGILNINGIIKQIDTNKTFAQHVETLKKYIETINGVELDKLNKMQNFVDSMNKLSQNLGNLDNLTDAIANRLSSVLFELVNQLTQADKSISNAHKLQDERKKLIEESVSKIENLMSQHMIVEISQMTDEEKKQQSAQTPGGAINGKPTDTSSPQGTDTTVKSSEEKLGSPDNAQATKEPGSTTNSQGLTMAQFRQYMEQEYIKKIRKEINPDIIG